MCHCKQAKKPKLHSTVVSDGMAGRLRKSQCPQTADFSSFFAHMSYTRPAKTFLS